MANTSLDEKSPLGMHIDAAFSLAQSGNLPSAMESMEAACRLDTASSSTFEMLAQFLLEGDRPEDALQAAQVAADLNDRACPSLKKDMIIRLRPSPEPAEQHSWAKIGVVT